jgi:tetratricopeptide (TPR) repeat protein
LAVCLAIGGAVLEWLTRPDDSLTEGASTGERPGPIPGNATAAPALARLTLEELLAESRRLATQLEATAGSAEALNLAGSIYQSIQDADRAVDCWHRTLQLRPGSPQVNFNLGIVAWQGGDFERAEEYFLRTYTVQPDLGGLRYHLADTLLKLGEAGRAVEVLAGASDLAAYGAQAHCVLGQAYSQVGEWENARASFAAALIDDPHSREAHYGMVRVMRQLGQPDKMEEHRQALAQVEAGERAQTLVAGRPGEAEQIVGDAGQIRERLAIYCQSAAAIYSHLGRNEEAQRLSMRAAALRLAAQPTQAQGR